MSRHVHPTAILSAETELGEGVEIGPYCVLTGKVRLGDGVRLISNVHINGPTEIGARTVVYPGACIGYEPQDVKFKPGMPTAGVKIGSDCLLREHVTIHLASKLEHPTTVGNECFLMVNTHLGHDARIGNGVVMVNASVLGGHAQLGDKVTMGGLAAVHQFCRVGRLAFVSGAVGLSMEVPPFCLSGKRNELTGINVVGLRRSGVPRDEITAVRSAFRRVFRQLIPRAEMIQILDELGRESALVREQAEFVRTAKRAIALPPGRGKVETADAASIDG